MTIIRKIFDYWYLLEEKLLPDELREQDGLIIWKERVLYLSFLCVVVFGLIALVPSLILAYQRGLTVVFVLDIMAYLIVIAFLLPTRISLKVKTLTSLAVLYALGIVLLIFTGYYGAGYIWLFGASMFAIVFFNNKYGLLIIFVNLLIFLSIGAYIAFGFPIWHYLLENPIEIWIILTVNFMAVNALMILVIARAKSNIDEAVKRQVDAQKSLIDEKEFSDYIIQSIPGLFFLFELQKDGRLFLKRWNENVSTLLGYSNEELNNMNSLQFFEKTNRLYVEKIRRQLLKRGSLNYEIDALSKSGRVIPTYVQAHSFKKKDKHYIVGIAVDISSRKAEEKEKERFQKSIAASQKASALGTLSSGIAHDFNNILSGILGYAELIRMAPDDPVRVNKSADQILKGSGRAKELVQQILTFSRQGDSEKKLVKPYLIVKETLKFMRSSIPTTIEIKEKIESRNPIHADATQLHQVIMNMCTNAYHAMRDTGGILAVELSETHISAEDQIEGHIFVPGDYLLLKISDTGRGMDKITLERMFEPYFTTKESAEGTGLGLAVVHGIIKEHHGHIQVDSKLGDGTTFYLYFPLLEDTVQSEAHKKAQRLPRENKNKGRILVADDELSIRVFMRSFLKKYGYYVEVYPNGKEALERFMEDPNFFDLVITDVAMPKISGDKLAKEILKTREGTPIIVQTGYAESFDEKAAGKAGVIKYFQKPVDSKKLLLAIQDILPSS